VYLYALKLIPHHHGDAAEKRRLSVCMCVCVCVCVCVYLYARKLILCPWGYFFFVYGQLPHGEEPSM
jgi:hypothetical protein